MNQAQSPARRPKIRELDLLRAWAILGVVLIHSTSDATAVLRKGSSSQLFFYMLNQGVLNQFAVPAFLFISGVVLFYRYYDSWSLKDVPAFYTKRLWSALLPLVVWSFFYYIVDQWIYAPTVVVDLKRFYDLLWWGDAKYHLYFLIIIIQFYLLFPIVMTLVKLRPWVPHLLIPVGIAVQAAYYLIGHYHEAQFAPAFSGWWLLDLSEKPTNATNYMGVLLAGAYIGIYYQRFVALVRRPAVFWGLLAASVIVIAAYCSFLWQAVYNSQPVSNNWFVALRFLFSVLFTAWLMEACRRLLAYPRAIKPLLSLGAASFTVYLLHPLLLNLYDKHMPVPGGIAAYDLFVAGKFAVGLGGAWLVGAIYGWRRFIVKKR